MRPPKGVLLDTHVLLWALGGSARLGTRVVAVLEAATPVYFSPVSLAEIALKVEQGKLPAISNLLPQLEECGFRSLPLDGESALGISRFPGLERHDPFDRLLVSQALAHSLFFETADRRLLELDIPGLRDATS